MCLSGGNFQDCKDMQTQQSMHFISGAKKIQM